VTVSEAIQAGAPKSEATMAAIDNDGRLTRNDWELVDMGSPSEGESG